MRSQVEAVVGTWPALLNPSQVAGTEYSDDVLARFNGIFVLSEGPEGQAPVALKNGPCPCIFPEKI